MMPVQNAKKWSLFDLLIVGLVALALFVGFFAFVKPVTFSGLIQREGTKQYAEIEVILPDDLKWVTSKIEVGEEKRNVYGDLDWEVLGFFKETIDGKEWSLARLKVLIVKESSGLLRFGKYTLVSGSKIYFISDDHFLEGRVYNVTLLDQNYLL